MDCLMAPNLVLLLCAITIIHSVYARATDKDSSYFSRYDRNEYVKAQGIKYRNNYNQALLDPSILKILRRKLSDNNGRISDSNASFDDPNPCTTYLAPSSIPNSGLGIYTTISYQKGESFIYPDIGILLHGFADKMLAEYPWQAMIASLDDHPFGDMIVPGLGMLGNGHLGLINFHHSEVWWKSHPRFDQPDTLSIEGLRHSTLEDVGRGASTLIKNMKFHAMKNITEGEELFLDYGDSYFLASENDIGIVPGTIHYMAADKTLKAFWDDIVRIGKWEKNISEYRRRYKKILKRAEDRHKRLRAAFPNDVRDVPAAVQMGTARFSVPKSYQSKEWLGEHGACIDRIVSGVSTIPQAGQGAFAIRTIKRGEIITTTPLVSIDIMQIHHWQDYEQGGKKYEGYHGKKLLLNYCFGDDDSSVLLFPYSPSVNFINHGDIEEFNAEIRWSSFPYHKSGWLNGTWAETIEKQKTGLMFDVIATKDIQRGDEILIHYGKVWEKKWEDHIKQWELSYSITDAHGYPTTVDLNQIEKDTVVRTIEEQNTDPYPLNILTGCYFSPPSNCTPPSTSVPGVQCQAPYTFTVDAYHFRSCDILSRNSFDDVYWYTAKANVTDGNDVVSYLVEYLPRYAIRFIDRPYSRDHYRKDAFRQMIGLKDGVLPRHWLKYGRSEFKTEV